MWMHFLLYAGIPALLGPVLLLLALRRVVVRKRSFGSPSLVALGALCWALIIIGLRNRPNLL